eukprot:15448155-Alexandrium_andersonii.AAC.1
MQACRRAWNHFVATVGPDFINNLPGEEAARLTSDPTKVPEGSWVPLPTPEERRISDVVCVFRSLRTSSSDAFFEAPP